MKYALAAIYAANLLQENRLLSPLEAWQLAIKVHYPNSPTSQEKGCPRNTFLALCETCQIKGIKAGIYTSSKDNKRYALKALQILKSNSSKAFTPAELWEEVLKFEDDKSKRYNEQMNVVLGLVQKDLLLV